jgi:hypothetical protein
LALVVRTPSSNSKDQKANSSRFFTWNSEDSDSRAIVSTFFADKAKTVEIQTDMGHINLIGHNGDQVIMKVRSTKANMDREEIYQHFDVMNVTSDDKIELRIKKKDSGWLEGLRFGLEIDAQVPNGKNVIVHTSGGHITTSGVDGYLDLKTNGGHITIEGNRGQVKAVTNGGHLNCENIEGDTELVTKGGHINVENCTGRIFAHTYGGHVNLDRVQGRIDAKSNGGNVSASILDFIADANFETTAGKVAVTVPSSFAGVLDLNGSNVDVSGTSDFNGTKTSRSVEGYVSNKNHKLSARSSIGVVKVHVN